MKLLLVLLLAVFSFSILKAQDTIARVDTLPIYTIVEQMPIFPGCEDLASKAEQKTCTDKNLLKWIYQNATYPSVDFYKGDLSNTFQVVSFVVDTTGTIVDIQSLRGTGEFATEIRRVIATMNEELPPWTPREQRGEKVQVRIHLPIRITLSKN